MRLFHCILLCMWCASSAFGYTDEVKTNLGASSASPAINSIRIEGLSQQWRTAEGFPQQYAIKIQVALDQGNTAEGKVRVIATGNMGRTSIRGLGPKLGIGAYAYTIGEVTEGVPLQVSCYYDNENYICPNLTGGNAFGWVKFSAQKKCRVTLGPATVEATYVVCEGSKESGSWKEVDKVKLQAGERVTKEYKVASGADLYVYAQYTSDGMNFEVPAGSVLNSDMQRQSNTGNPQVVTTSVEGKDQNVSSSAVDEVTQSAVTTTAAETDAARDRTLVAVGLQVATASSNAGASVKGAVIDKGNQIVDALGGVKAAIQDLKNTSSGGSSGGTGGTTTSPTVNVTVDNSAVVSKLDEVKAKQEEGNTNTKGLLDLLSAGKDFNTNNSLTQATALANAASKYGGPTPSGDGAVSTGGVSPSNLGEVTVGDRKVTFGFDLSSGVFADADNLLRTGRSLILWAMVVWFLASCAGVLDKYLIGLASTDSGGTVVGPENVVPGIAQAKTWGAAGIVVAAIVAAAGSMVAILDTWATSKGLGIGSLLSGMELGTLGAGVGLLDRYLPVAAAVQLGVFRAAFSYMCAPIYTGVVAIIKFTKA